MYQESSLKMERPSTASRVEFDHSRPVQQVFNRDRNDTQSVDSGFLSEFDEETIRWGVLVTRIVSIFLFCCVIAAVFLGETANPKIFILAAIFAVVLVIVFMCSFIDMQMCRSSASWHGEFDVLEPS